jgi:predicted molibdopterin-dependent oxidoreductase YjgC
MSNPDNFRILEHPILGKIEERKKITIYLDDKKIPAFEGEPIAAALAAAGTKVFRLTSEKNEPRGIFCAIGRCTDCVMTVNGEPNVRTCVTLAREGMKVETQKGLGEWQKKV